MAQNIIIEERHTSFSYWFELYRDEECVAEGFVGFKSPDSSEILEGYAEVYDD